MTASPWEQYASRLDRDPIISVADIPLCFYPRDVEVKGKTVDLDTEI